MLRAVRSGTTAWTSTSVKRLTLSRISSSIASSLRRMMMSGWMPMPRSVLTECWVGFVFSSPVAPIDGSQVTWT